MRTREIVQELVALNVALPELRKSMLAKRRIAYAATNKERREMSEHQARIAELCVMLRGRKGYLNGLKNGVISA